MFVFYFSLNLQHLIRRMYVFKYKYDYLQTVNLKGWKIRREIGNKTKCTYEFKNDLMLGPGQKIKVRTLSFKFHTLFEGNSYQEVLICVEAVFCKRISSFSCTVVVLQTWNSQTVISSANSSPGTREEEVTSSRMKIIA